MIPLIKNIPSLNANSNKFMKNCLIFIFLLFISSCHNSPNNLPLNKTIENPKSDDFSFAIISDLNGGEREGVFENAVNKINRFSPVFTLSVGDLIDGGIKDSLLISKQWENFNKRLEALESPFFYVGGNHDLSNSQMVKAWGITHGPSYYHFIYKNVLFLILNSEDFDEERFEEISKARELALKILSKKIEGNYEETEYYKMKERMFGDISIEQQLYFEDVIEMNQDVRWTFLFMHKPIWKNQENEKFNSILKKLDVRQFSVFSGHEHSFSHQMINGKSYTILSTTGGSQNVEDQKSFDHFTWVSMKEKPRVSHLLLSGVLNESGESN